MLSEFEKQIVRELQKNLPLVKRPFKEVAHRLNMNEQELIEKIKELKQKGIIRRFGAAVKHQNLGYIANAMVVWEIPEDKIVEAGEKMASFPDVTHCYQRLTCPGWQYNLFTVVHGKSKEDCEKATRRIALETGYHNYRLLYSTRELKKSSMKYFLD